MTKRPYGSGSVYVYTAANGRRSWYGRWRTPGGRQRKKRLGAVRDGRGPGLTQLQAEQELGRLLLLVDDRDAGEPDVRATIPDAGADLLAHLAEIGRKRSTISSYESMLRVHLTPYFGSTVLRDIRRRDIETFARAKHREGSSSKTIRNLLGVLHTLFQHARRQEWVEANPVSLAHRPRAQGEKDIRFLTLGELERVLAKIGPKSTYGAVDRAMVLTAAHTGLRKGELCGLRWSDVDLAARRIRVRRSFVRGEFDTPQSARGSRSVPISTPLAGALETWRKTTFYSEDDDLVSPIRFMAGRCRRP